VKMDEWLEIGVFADAPNGNWELGEPMYLKKHRIRSGSQTITVTVPDKPHLAGIDPFHVLDWEEREDDDNTNGVNIESGE
jgi:ABC-2 type transport system permease protein